MTMFGSQWLANAGAGYEISQSIRFNDDDSAYLENANYSSSPTSGTDCTFSFWVKRCRLGATQICIYGGDASGSTYEGIRFDSDDQFRVFQASSAYDIISTQVFRDVSAWSHFVVAFNTDDSTAADRIKIYHNGSRITDFSLQTNPSSGYVTNFNTGGSGEAIQIGREGGNSQFLDGYMAEIVFIDGQALTPASFGETNDDGVWIPKNSSSLTFGTNGYYLKGQDSSALGDDTSGNGNDFTSSGLATTDQMLDTPTKNFCMMNPLDAPTGSITLSNGNLDLNQSSFNKVRGTIAFDVQDDDGFYFEVKKTSGNFRSAGIVATDASNFAAAQSLLSVNPSVVYYMEGGEVNQNGSQILASLPTFATNDVLGVAVRNGKVYFAKNNTWVNSGDPVNETGQVASITGSSPLYSPAVGEQNNQSGITNTVNFGATAFAHTPPTGYKALNTANLATPSITDGSKYFQPTIYTGNGTAIGSGGLEVNQSGNSTFQPDFAWIKNRTTSGNEHDLYDAVRGVTKVVFSSTAGAEATVSEGLTAFDADGFTVGNRGEVNTSGNSMVAWQWKANGAGSSNTDGSITSTVSPNTTAGFSIVKYTGTGANATVGHGLGAVPKMIIIKDTTNAESWIVYHEGVGNDGNLYLNLTNSKATQAIFQNTTPTSSVFSLGGTDGANKASAVHVAYCFAEIPGYSSIGSYTGNGSTDGTFVYTGFKPSFILTKNMDTADQWGIRDATRNPFNVTDKLLNPNASTAETSAASGYIDILSNGFKPRSSDSNINTQTIIYMAFAENPFGGDGVAPATAR